MTILEAITLADARRHNPYPQEEKIRWLSELDGKIRLLVLDACEHTEKPFPGYDRDTDPNRVLLVDKPFEELYLYWLESRICYADGEMEDYNSAITQYNRLYEAYTAAYRRSHMPRGGRRFLF